MPLTELKGKQVKDGSIALADMANMATASLIYRKSSGDGPPEVNSLATLKEDLGVSASDTVKVEKRIWFLL